MPSQSQTGGCQCGAVRFRIDGNIGTASVCHCRMCQKAFGSLYAPLVSLGKAAITWTRGSPATFQSSNFATRGFCSACGTPLTYDAPDGLALAIGAFDDPRDIVPATQFGLEAKLPYTDTIPSLPNHQTLDDLKEAPFLANLVSYQHPDHDTDTWPPAGKNE
jgi:hypothetical protein